MSDLTFFCDYGCPYAHRVLAMLKVLELDFEHREARLGEKPPGVRRFSASGRIPLLVHGDLVLTESRVILDYLNERFGYLGYSDDFETRTRQRHAIALVDEYLTPAVFGPITSPDLHRLEEGLDVFEAAMTTPQTPSLFALCIAPIWWRLFRLRPASRVVSSIQSRPELLAWMQGAAELECIVETAPEMARASADLAWARQTGLI